jgi:photosystem II stability/assembly factor-like uncharacterized protein
MGISSLAKTAAIALCSAWLLVPQATQGQSLPPAPAPTSNPASLPAPPDANSLVVAWADFTSGLLEPGILAVSPDPSTPNAVWAAARGSLYYSEDNGASWLRVGRFAGRVDPQEDDADDATLNLRNLEQQVQEDAAQELGDVLGLDDFDVLDDPNNLDFDLLFEDRLLEERFNRNLDGGGGDDTASPRRVNLPARIAIAKRAPDVVFVAATSGLYRSRERGTGLRLVSLPDTFGPKQVALDPSGLVVLVGTTRGLLRSDDGGDTWQEAPEAGLRGQSISEVQIDATDANRVAVLTKRAVFLSTDGGRSFTPTANTPPGILRDVAQVPGQAGALYAASTQGLFYSNDSGASWEDRIKQPQALIGIPALHVEVSAADGKQVFLATAEGKVYLSGDQGKSFRETGEGLPQRPLFALSASPLVPELVFGATGEGFYRYGLIRVGEISEREQKRLFDAFRDEPSADEVVSEAIRIASLQEAPLTKLKKRAVLSAYMPRLRAQVTTFLNKDQTLNDEAGAPLQLQSARRAQTFATFLTVWDLSRIANWGSGRTKPIEQQLARKRSRTADGIYKLYEERRALQLRLLKTPPATDLDYLKAELRLEEMTSLLDAKSNGYFSAAREKRRKFNAATVR